MTMIPTHPRRGAVLRLLARAVALVLGVSIMAAGSGRAATQAEPLHAVRADTTAALRIVTATDTFTLRVEVAAREEQRSQGLMERTVLDRDAGMIFLYNGSEQPADAGFWMYRMHIPLDIAFLDRDGTILRILSMEPCPDPDPRGCRTYSPGVAYYGALEVNRGYFAERGIQPGARVILGH
jgi:uncharacterized protein